MLLNKTLTNYSRFLRDPVALPPLRAFVCKYCAPLELSNAHHASPTILRAHRDEHTKIVTIFVLGSSTIQAGQRKAGQAEGGLKDTRVISTSHC